MTIDHFRDRFLPLLWREFEKGWRRENKYDPETFPLDMTEYDWRESFLEWLFDKNQEAIQMSKRRKRVKK